VTGPGGAVPRGEEDLALAVWSVLARPLAPFGVRVGPTQLALLRDMRAAGFGVFGPDGRLRAEAVEELAAMVETLRAHVSDRGPAGPV